MLTGDGLRLEVARDVLDAHDAVADLVGVEDVGRQGVAAPVAGAKVWVNPDAGHGWETGKTSGSDSTDRSAAV